MVRLTGAESSKVACAKKPSPQTESQHVFCLPSRSVQSMNQCACMRHAETEQGQRQGMP